MKNLMILFFLSSILLVSCEGIQLQDSKPSVWEDDETPININTCFIPEADQYFYIREEHAYQSSTKPSTTFIELKKGCAYNVYYHRIYNAAYDDHRPRLGDYYRSPTVYYYRSPTVYYNHRHNVDCKDYKDEITIRDAENTYTFRTTEGCPLIIKRDHLKDIPLAKPETNTKPFFDLFTEVQNFLVKEFNINKTDLILPPDKPDWISINDSGDMNIPEINNKLTVNQTINYIELHVLNLIYDDLVKKKLSTPDQKYNDKILLLKDKLDGLGFIKTYVGDDDLLYRIPLKFIFFGLYFKKKDITFSESGDLNLFFDKYYTDIPDLKLSGKNQENKYYYLRSDRKIVIDSSKFESLGKEDKSNYLSWGIESTRRIFRSLHPLLKSYLDIGVIMNKEHKPTSDVFLDILDRLANN